MEEEPAIKRQCVENRIVELRQQEIEKWKSYENAADEMIPILGHLYRNQNVICTIFGKGLVHKSTIDIIKIHSFVCKHLGYELTPLDSIRILKALSEIPNLKSIRIDLARTYWLVFYNKPNDTSIFDRLRKLISDQTALVQANPMTEPVDIVLYGFGRIGRLLARLLIEKSGAGVKLMLRAIVVRKGSKEDLMKRASLLRRDSVHGPFQGTISFDEDSNSFIANGSVIQVIYSDGPDKCDYRQYGINNAIVIDNTGRWRDEQGLGLHLKSPGVAKVMLTAPGKGDITTIVAGVNNDRVKDDINMYSAASCTTNAITPILSVIDKKYGIQSGHIEAVHSFTNDQNLIDNYHAKERRGRSAVLNMVLTETGAASAVTNCLPEMVGKLTANAIRVPTPNVSLAILMLQLNTDDLTKEQVNAYLSRISVNSPLQNQIDFSNSAEAASSDFVGSRASAIVDGKATILRGNQLNLYVWYDNEFGYSCQVVRLLQKIAKIHHTRFPDESHVADIDSSMQLPLLAPRSS